MYQSYSLTRCIDIGAQADKSTMFTVADDDAINCAHMIATAFNTMSRKVMGDFVLAVVDTKAGTVQYNGKIETIERPKADEPWSFSKTFNFEVSSEQDGMSMFIDDEGGALLFPSNLKIKTDEPSEYAHIAREVLESAYEELQAVKEVLSDAGVETIPADAGATDLRAVLRARDIEIAELVQERTNANTAARAELISYVKRAHAKKVRLQTAVPDGDGRPELDDRWRGMLDVLAKFLVVTGEADQDESHAVARRLCQIED
jgi:hypothetical protein